MPSLPLAARPSLAGLLSLCLYRLQAAAPTVDDALKLRAGSSRRLNTTSPRPTKPRPARSTPRKIGKITAWVVRDPGGVILRQFSDSQRRQRRRHLELLQERPRGLSRRRPELQRQGRPVPLVPHRRLAVGPRQERRRQARRVEADLAGRGGGRGDRRLRAEGRGPLHSLCCSPTRRRNKLGLSKELNDKLTARGSPKRRRRSPS